jgi:hypothetical protein
MIGKIQTKSKFNSEKIWKMRTKSKLNSEMILKIWKKSQLNMVVKRYGNYGRKIS